MPKRLTLLTDFETRDGYVGAMKGVIASIAADVVVDDIAHDIPRGDIEAAAWALGAYWRRYPEGTVHVVVVDPGVGTARRALAAEADGRFLVGPDNGVLSWALREAWHAGDVRAIDTAADAAVAPTFHGRDVFAPAAARLARGESIATVGAPALGIVRLPWPEPVRRRDGVEGVVVHVDRFGNLVTNLSADSGETEAVLRIGGVEIEVRRTYGDVGPGEPIAYVGSRGLIEIAIRDGSASGSLGAKGSEVTFRR